MSKKRKTISINEQRVRDLESLAMNATIKAGKIITWTDIVNHAIDNYGKDSAKDLMHAVSDQKN